VVALAAGMALAGPAAAGEAAVAPAGIVQVRLGGRFTAGTVSRVLAGARARLEQPGCQRIYTDFRDPSGRPLQAVLDEAGRSGAEFLGTLLFYDGADQPRCEASRTLAFTVRGGHVVFVCTQRFTMAAVHDPRLAEAALIHESLHGLGLGENPPSSAEITARVLARCSH